MEYDFREILDIGLEIEFSNLKRETPNFINNMQRKLNNFKHVHDASTETPELVLGNIPIQFEVNGKTNKLLSILRNRGLEIYGGELNSPILAANDFRQQIYRLMDFLIDMGESFSTTEQDNRGSIHVHINVSKDIKHKHLIRLLETGLATEAIFYRLGGMGRVNRGVKNSFIYQRPLTLPPCVRYDNTYYPIFDYKDLLESKNKTDFYGKYGDTVSHIRSGNHYVTQRYMGLNFYSIPYRGSIEFRYANKVLIPEWIVAWIILCQSFVNYALTKPKDESFENTYRKLEDNIDIPLHEVKEIFDKFEISEDYQITLFDIWKQTDMPYFNGKQIVTHLQNPSFYTGNFPYITKPIENAERIIVDDVRTVSTAKSNKLVNIQMENKPELDYVIDTNGVKSKLKEMGIRVEEDLFVNPIQMNRDNYIRNWMRAGFNIENYSREDADEYIQQRVLREKSIPICLLEPGMDYECDTIYNDLKIIFNIDEPDSRIINLSFYDIHHGNESRMMRIETERNDELNTRIFNPIPYINDCHRNPETYFNQEEEDNQEEDINFGEEFGDANPDINNFQGNINELRIAANNAANAMHNIRWEVAQNNQWNIVPDDNQQNNNPNQGNGR